LTEVISVRFRNGSKNYFFDPQGIQVRMGEQVIVQTAQGLELAICTQGNHEVEDEILVKPLSAVVRTANDNDRRILEYNRKKEREAFDICERKIAEHGLIMKLVNVSAGFDSNKIVFYFTADGRVDFRELVRDLASVFRARIELRQIGVRDEAKMIGGLGICGRPFCCSSFLESFMPVSIKMAKTQNLSLNPTKISGTCGRLMCCLKYEQNVYEDAAKRMPKMESFVQTPDGPGNVKGIDLLREMVKVSLDSAPEALKSYHNCEIQVLRNGKGSRDGIELPDRPARFVEEPQEEELVPPVFSIPFHMDTPLPPEKTAEEKPLHHRRRTNSRKPPRPAGGKPPRSGKPPVKGESRNSDSKRRPPYRGGRRWNKGEQPNKG
jgi:cell fate regulator YaaT (PSP1 superfamily)